MRLTYIFHDFFISGDPHLLTGYESGNRNLYCIGVKILLQIESFILLYQLYFYQIILQ